MQIRARCPHCSQPVQATLKTADLSCPSCAQPVLDFATPAFEADLTLDQCPVCGTQHLYRRKDFNRKWGLALVALGILGAYWTYGLSLIAVTLVDWILARRVGEVGLCYHCETTFRAHPAVHQLPEFDLELHDYYRNVKEKNKN